MQGVTLLVGPSERGMRVDRFLVSHMPQSWSRTAAQRLIEAGGVLVDGKPVKASHVLQPGQTVAVRFGSPAPAPPREAHETPEAIPLSIVYEDGDVLVVNKPPGLVTHPAPGHWSGTLVNALLWHLHAQGATLPSAAVEPDDAAGDIEPLEDAAEEVEPVDAELPRAGIVHRLDKDTSGLLLVAKTDAALRWLSGQLKARTISRRYLAIVERHVPIEQGTINAPIGRHAVNRKVMAIRHLGGRHAVTHYRVLAHVTAELPEAGEPKFLTTADGFPYTILEASLETGRTHQVRVHVAHLGHPILGDTVYGKHPASFWQRHGVTRQLLHAYALRFTHPRTKATISLTAPVPDDMRRWIPADALRRIAS
jgi:23S rRNA pseudouridine1911/1915/1917 synthase